MKKNTQQEESNFDSRKFLSAGAKEKSLGIFGSRSLGDDRVKNIILEALRHGNFTKLIVCLEPAGVSAVARSIASEFGFPLQLHSLNLKYLRGAFDQRSKEVVALADEFLIIHDGKSPGTANEKLLCEKSGKPIQYEILEPCKNLDAASLELFKEIDQLLAGF